MLLEGQINRIKINRLSSHSGKIYRPARTFINGPADERSEENQTQSSKLFDHICFNKINAGYINQQLYAMGKICETNYKQIRAILFEKNNNESKMAVI